MEKVEKIENDVLANTVYSNDLLKLGEVERECVRKKDKK